MQSSRGKSSASRRPIARSERHADIGAATLEAWRGRGLATAAAALVARRVQEAGQTPVWSAGEDNAASLRVAQKIGFTAVSRRTYSHPAARECRLKGPFSATCRQVARQVGAGRGDEAIRPRWPRLWVAC